MRRKREIEQALEAAVRLERDAESRSLDAAVRGLPQDAYTDELENRRLATGVAETLRWVLGIPEDDREILTGSFNILGDVPGDNGGGANASAHTPGPWEAYCVSGAGWSVRRSAPRPQCEGKDPICSMAWWQFDVPGVIDDQISEANARLIAAAPALLEALEEFLEAEAEASWRPKGERGPIIKPARDKAKSAIALARKGGEA